MRPYLNYIICLALLFVAGGAYQTATYKWGWWAGVISVILAFGLPFSAFQLWGDVYADHKKEEKERRGEKQHQSRARQSQNNYLQLLASLMAKMVQVDGHVDERELREAGRIFEGLGFTPPQIQICIQAFHDALSQPLSGTFSAIYFAKQMVVQGFSDEMRRIAYEILWDIACADGVLARQEKALLVELEPVLQLPAGSFRFYYAQRVKTYSQGKHQDVPPSTSQDDALTAAYDTLGCPPTATNEELRQAYRSLVKKLHPDVLRAEGIPESLMAKANERMARINLAWKTIKQSRHFDA